MYWQESTSDKPYQVPDSIVDVAFRIACAAKALPLEHAHALSRALHEALPWLADEESAGVHLIHGAESGNGWMRPENPDNELLYVSRRTRMTLRLPKQRVADAGALTGATLDIDGYPLEVGEATVKPLANTSTLFSRYVVDERGGDVEAAFVAGVAAEIQRLGVPVRKLLCGKSHVLRTPDGPVFTRSVLIADLDAPESVTLQQQGVGPHRKLGCGLFIAHKGIAPVKAGDD